MRRTRPDLVVPIRDRRQHRRILTLRNFGYALIVLVALLAGVTIAANLRDRHPRADFGRLYSGRMQTTAPVSKQPDVVKEEPIRDETAADPMLVQPAARSQILLDEHGQETPRATVAVAPVSPAPSAVPVSPAPATAPLLRDSSSNVTIVGGPEGVQIVKRDRARPVLGGGFGRE